MYFGNRSQDDDFTFNRTKLKNGFEENILIIITDNQLVFKPHIRNICLKKTAQKLGVLNRLSSFLDPKQKGLVFKADH